MTLLCPRCAPNVACATVRNTPKTAKVQGVRGCSSMVRAPAFQAGKRGFRLVPCSPAQSVLSCKTRVSGMGPLRRWLSYAGGLCPRCAPESAEEGRDVLSLLRERDGMAEALRRIHETASWYAKNGDRLAHEVDHALCVEVLSYAEDGLA